MLTTRFRSVPRRALLALGALGALGVSASAQSENPFEARQPAAPGAEPGPALPEPGVLPVGTSPEAAKLWGLLCAATRPPAEAPAELGATPPAERAPLESFDLAFDATIRDGRKQNEATFRQRFLAPHFVRTVILDGGGERELGRDSDGYWLRDPKDRDKDGKARIVRLDGRAYQTDRRQIDDVLALSESFRAFADPSVLRLSRLALATPPLCELPDEGARAGAGLDWLELESPDFHLPGTPRLDPEGRPLSAWLRLGLDPETHLVRQALILAPAARTSEDAPPERAAHFMILGGERNRYRTYGGYRLPMGIDLWQFTLRETTTGGETIRRSVDVTKSPGQSFALKNKLVVNPPLTPDDFKP